jgi:RNA polymerase sigma-70 factor, ECF subfamily
MNAQSEQEDKMLMAKLASGDESALDKLYQKHWRTIDAFVRGKLFGALSDTDAPDIVQDIFRRIQQKAHLYKPSGKVLSWMRMIARNIIIDIVRQHLSRRRRD